MAFRGGSGRSARQAKFRDNAGSILIQDHDKLPGVVSVKRAD
jgi:hypothetical protein